MLVAQRQQIEREVKEIDRAFSELQKHPDDSPAYKIVGGIMIRKDRLSLLKDLTESKELLNIRAPSIKQQEARMKQEIQRRQQHLQESMQREESQQAYDT